MRRSILIILCIAVPAVAGEADAEQARRDAATVEALLRLDDVDIHGHPRLKEAVLRYLDANEGTERFLTLIERFEVRERSDALLRLALDRPADTRGVDAARLLIEFGELHRLRAVIEGQDQGGAVAAVTVLGYTAQRRALELLAEVMRDEAQRQTVRRAAVAALSRTRSGERMLLGLAESGGMPSDLEVMAANLLHASLDAETREAAAEHLPLPAAADRPLPPVSELTGRRGDATHGRTVFMRTCIACHTANGAGIEFGPNLGDVGDKLAREELYLSILDPDASISFGYEGHLIRLDDGTELLGYITSETEDRLTLRIPGGIDRRIDKPDIAAHEPYRRSLMTPGLQRAMTEQELVDLVEYLTTLRSE